MHRVLLLHSQRKLHAGGRRELTAAALRPSACTGDCCCCCCARAATRLRARLAGREAVLGTNARTLAVVQAMVVGGGANLRSGRVWGAQGGWM